MPDVHAGDNCVIGFTADLGEKVIPSIVGNDIGCGMFCANLGQIDIDYEKLDNYIYAHIPNGNDVNEQPEGSFDFSRLYCFNELKSIEFLNKSIGTLGGGNHFIEIDESQDGDKYLIIHTGSRNLGSQVAKYYQNLANKKCNHDNQELYLEMKSLLKKYKEQGKEKEISNALDTLKRKYNEQREQIPFEFVYLEGKEREEYLHDMKICQEYAKLNRLIIANKIARHMNWVLNDYFECVHNYISLEDNIVRKGSISAKKGEKVIIPINMRDGCIIGIGKGNDDWNNSAPHGAGRIMSRKEATNNINLEEYKNTMSNIYSTSVNENTLDESPFAYKSLEEIQKNITPTVDITNIIKPVYNFKSSSINLPKEKNEEESKFL